MEQFISATPVASLIFIFTIVTSIYAFSNPTVYGKFMLHPYSVYRGDRVYSVITSGLIHKDWGHLFVNMLSYFFFAFQLERVFVQNSSWGHLQFALLYSVSLILSDLSSIIKHKDHFWYNSLGASGAVSAVVFSWIMFDPLGRIYVYFIPMPAGLFGILYLAYSAYESKRSSSINHDAHFFGALTGILLTIIFYPDIVPHFVNTLFKGF